MRRVESETLQTERLILRPYRPEDEADMLALVTDPEVMRFVGDGPMTAERGLQVFRKVFELYEKGAWGIWAVEEQATGRFAGSAEIKPRADEWEIVYVLASEAWGKGYATEVARALVRFGLDRLGLERVIATVDYGNAVSLRVLEKVGMRWIAEDHDDDGPFAVYGVSRDGAAEPGSPT